MAPIHREFGISQSAVSQHLGILRESGFATARVAVARRLYVIEARPLREVDAWLRPFRRFWRERLNALAEEVARGKRDQGEKG